MRPKQQMNQNASQVPDDPLIELLISKIRSLVSLRRLVLRVEQIFTVQPRGPYFLLVDNRFQFPFIARFNKVLSSQIPMPEALLEQTVDRLDYILKNNQRILLSLRPLTRQKLVQPKLISLRHQNNGLVLILRAQHMQEILRVRKGRRFRQHLNIKFQGIVQGIFVEDCLIEEFNEMLLLVVCCLVDEVDSGIFEGLGLEFQDAGVLRLHFGWDNYILHYLCAGFYLYLPILADGQSVVMPNKIPPLPCQYIYNRSIKSQIIMKLHNSTEIGHETPLSSQRKFIIRYHESHSFSSSKKTKYRYTQGNNDTMVLRSCLMSEADVYRDERSLEQKELEQVKEVCKTDRPKRRSFKSPSNIGSVMDLIEGVKPVTGVGKEKEHYERQFPKIPIQYNDERINGPIADNMRLKVIYRGYAPKNTYYFLKSLAFNELQLKPSIKRSEFELQFQSKFQSGNLSAVARKSQKQFYLFMREDTNTFGLRQWYYFSVSNKKSGKFKFRVYKFSKFYSLYKEGMKPFVRNMDQLSEWRQGGQNVKYEFDPDTKNYFLQFQYEFPNDNMTVQFATQPPYTYAMLKNYLKLLLQKYQGIRIVKAGQSLSGLDIPRIEIINKDQKNQSRKVIIIMARTHPGQTASNWALESLIDRIYEVPELRNYFDFYIIPMVNPDGVFLGNHRTGVLGQDINRNFTGIDLEFFPQVEVVQKLIENIQKQKQKQIEFLLDLHGHSARRNIFAYGDEHPIGTHAFLLTHILPKLIGENISTFKYNYCVFKGSKQKKNTARVFLSKKYKLNAITFEQSYGLIDEGAIGIQHWRNFGIALADSLKQYHQIVSKGSFAGLEEYLSDQIAYQKDKNEKRAKKKLQLNEDFKTQSNTRRENDQNQKFKTQMEYTNAEFSFKAGKYEADNKSISEKSNDDSINSEELSSGDEELQNTEQGMELLKKEMGKIGCFKEGIKREKYNIAERNIEIKSNFEPRLHEQKSSMVPRILKFQMRKRQEMANSKNYEEKGKKKLNITERAEKQSLQLPNLKKDRWP